MGILEENLLGDTDLTNGQVEDNLNISNSEISYNKYENKQVFFNY